MSNAMKKFLIWVMVGISMVFKLMEIYRIATGEWDLFSEAFDVSGEYLIYLFDGIIVLYIFMLQEKWLEAVWSKLMVGTSLSLGYTISIMLLDWFLLWLDWGVQFGDFWTEWMEPFDYNIRHLQRFLKSGQPKFHMVFLGMMAVLATIVLYRRYKDRILEKIDFFS